MKLNLEAKTKEQQRVKAYLEENASDILAGKINNGVLIKKDGKILLNRKTMDGFMSFATEEARKQAEKGARYAMVEDAVVFGWAVHYFEEDSIEGTLYTEDGSEYKAQPKPAAKAPTVKAQPKPQPKPQMSMFDLMGEDLEGKPEDDEDTMPSDEEIQEIMAEIAEEEKAKQQELRRMQMEKELDEYIDPNESPDFLQGEEYSFIEADDDVNKEAAVSDDDDEDDEDIVEEIAEEESVSDDEDEE